MIYDSIEIIPMKVYLNVEAVHNPQAETFDYLKLLSPDGAITDVEVLKLAWATIESQANEYADTKEDKKILNLSKKVEALSARNESVSLALHYLKEMPDDELIELLEGFGYKFRYKTTKGSKRAVRRQYDKDVERITRESVAIEIRLKAFRDKLPKVDPDEEHTPFDQTILSYCAFTEIGYINPNEITYTQYHALIANGNDKMKTLEKKAPTKNGKRKK